MKSIFGGLCNVMSQKIAFFTSNFVSHFFYMILFSAWSSSHNLSIYICSLDHLCGLVIRVPGYRSRGSGFDSWRSQIFWEVLDLEQVLLSLVRINEEPLGRNRRGSNLETQINGCMPLPAKIDTNFAGCGGRLAGIISLQTNSHRFFIYI
jgi:hypothetical protein